MKKEYIIKTDFDSNTTQKPFFSEEMKELIKDVLPTAAFTDEDFYHNIGADTYQIKISKNTSEFIYCDNKYIEINDVNNINEIFFPNIRKIQTQVILRLNLQMDNFDAHILDKLIEFKIDIPSNLNDLKENNRPLFYNVDFYLPFCRNEKVLLIDASVKLIRNSIMFQLSTTKEDSVCSFEEMILFLNEFSNLDIVNNFFESLERNSK